MNPDHAGAESVAHAASAAPLVRLVAAWEQAATALEQGDDDAATSILLMAQAILDALLPEDDAPALHAALAAAHERLGNALRVAQRTTALGLIDLARGGRAVAAYRATPGDDARFVDRRQ